MRQNVIENKDKIQAVRIAVPFMGKDGIIKMSGNLFVGCNKQMQLVGLIVSGMLS